MSDRPEKPNSGATAPFEDVIEKLVGGSSRPDRSSHALARLAMENTRDFIMLLEPDGTIRYANRAVPDLPAKKLLGTQIYEHLEDRLKATTRACLDRVLKSGTPDSYHFESLAADGEVSFYESRVAPVLHQGEVAALIVNRTDVTLHRKTIDALAASEERHRFLTANISDAIWTLDLDQRFQYVSPSIERLAGYTAEDFKTKGLKEVLSEDSYDRVHRALTEGLKHDSQPEVDPDRWRTLDLELRREDGSFVWTESKMKFLREEESGAPSGVLGVTRDISAWKKTQEELRMSEARLRQAQRLEAVGQLAGGVAHDFNNLLTVIQGNHDLLMKDFHGEDPRRARLAEIGKAADKAASLTRQLLAFARRQRLEPEVLRLNDVVSETGPILERLLPEDIRISVTLDPDLGYVEADRGQLEQVLLNLVVNARDAMPRGGLLRITTSNADLMTGYDVYQPPVVPDLYVRLEVSDNGTGIPEELQAKIFEPFFTTKEVGEGTGMGLATVYGIIKQSKGYVWVESTKGGGTTFEILLPRSSRAKTEERPPELPAAVTSGSEIVLLVEDEDAVRNLTGIILREFGYRVLEAPSGREAMEICATEGGRIDLLLTDLVMPEMWGDELAWRLRTAFPGIRVLYLSGYGDRRQQRRSSGDGSFLEKPFTAERLLEKVRQVLDADEPKGG